MTESGLEKKKIEDVETSSEGFKEAIQRKTTRATFLQTVTAVLWSFFGVRRGDRHESDMENLNPIHVIIVGVILAALFVIGLLFVVNLVVSSA